MKVTNTGFTIAEYCEQMKAGNIVVNRDYQRTETVWPPAARSYLIDTILHGYPIPKISLYQKTDLLSRKTKKEIVDGQQRSKAILDFYHDKLRISGGSEYSGKGYSDLEEADKKNFVEYELDVDLFTAATDDDIRQVFRRINSYTVPLNPEEHRHATHQGAFKWFVVQITEAYAPTLKGLGVLTERNLSRMQDAKLFTEVAFALEHGIQSYSSRKLDGYYRQYEEAYSQGRLVREQLDMAFERVLDWEDIHKGPLMKYFNFYSLLLAVIHSLRPVPALRPCYDWRGEERARDEVALANLGVLASALDEDVSPRRLRDFVEACSKATNTKNNREVRLLWLCKSLEPQLIT